MTQDLEMMPTKCPAVAVYCSAAARRMRLHRERRSLGLRCLTIELHETEIDALIREGLLTSETRNDQNAVCSALYEFLDSVLDAGS
jgi:hypothetical protein